MAKRIGAIGLRAALQSLFGKKASGPVQRPQESRRAARKRLWALVQTKPTVLVLLVSDTRENLEAEARELNETWNHRELRTERHTYEIQPVALLQTGREPAPRTVGQPGQQRVG